jgi:hypothetical protein
VLDTNLQRLDAVAAEDKLEAEAARSATRLETMSVTRTRSGHSKRSDAFDEVRKAIHGKKRHTHTRTHTSGAQTVAFGGDYGGRYGGVDIFGDV